MTVSTADIEHQDLDTEEGPEEPCTSVFVTVTTPDGMRYHCGMGSEGNADPELLVRMLLSSAEATARLHSREAGELLAGQLRPML